MKVNGHPNVFNRQWLAQPQQARAGESTKSAPIEKPAKVSATAKVMREQNSTAQQAIENFVPERTYGGVKKGQLIDIRV